MVHPNTVHPTDSAWTGSARRRAVSVVAGAALGVLAFSACSSHSAPATRGSPTTAASPGLSSSAPPSASGPGGTGTAPTVSTVQQPTNGHNGPVVTVDGSVEWVMPQGLPGAAQQCVVMYTAAQPPQILDLSGPPVDQHHQAAQHSRQETMQRVAVTGYVPASPGDVCGHLAFTVTQVTPMN